MIDVENIHNLFGTALMDFGGSLLNASIALLLLFHLSSYITMIVLCFVVVFAPIAIYLIEPSFLSPAPDIRLVLSLRVVSPNH